MLQGGSLGGSNWASGKTSPCERDASLVVGWGGGIPILAGFEALATQSCGQVPVIALL